MRCNHCNAELPDNTVGICPYCGSVIGSVSAGGAQSFRQPAGGMNGTYGAQAPGQTPVSQQQAGGMNGMYGTQAPGQTSVPQQPAGGMNGMYGTQAPGQIPVPQQQASDVQQTKKRSGGRSFGSLIIRYIVGFVLVALVAAGLGIFHQHSSFLSKGKTINLDEKLASGEGYPMNEFVHVDAAFILDQFAELDSTLNYISTGKDTYYVIVLKNNDLIAVKAASKDHIALLDQGAKDTLSYLNDTLEYFEDIPIEGKLIEFDNYEIKGFFDEYIQDSGLAGSGSNLTPRHYVIDMTAVRGINVLLYIVAPLAAVAILIIVIIKKRKAAAEQTVTG
ncbi:MAG: hypothetical protein K6G90_02085 [Clostridia bacterium]|nr:hypothetical protein [Clostridia bacterium]